VPAVAPKGQENVMFLPLSLSLQFVTACFSAIHQVFRDTAALFSLVVFYSSLFLFVLYLLSKGSDIHVYSLLGYLASLPTYV
jgi:hypothetical protein